MLKVLSKIKESLRNNSENHKQLSYLREKYNNEYKSPKVNLGQIQSSLNLNKSAVSSLTELEFQVFSQFGDDGIINWLTNKLPIENKTFIEFGVENYQEANTRFLLVNDYWSGLVIDGNQDNIDIVRSEQLYNFYDLDAVCNFITTDNINEIIASAKFHKDVGLLSVDVDGNDYWIWKAIDTITPIIVVSEYNCLFGFNDPFTIEYKSNFVRGTEFRFNYYGTSLSSLCDLSKEKGYSFIGSNSAGNNAYFIRNDFMHYLDIKALSAEEGYRLSSFSEVWSEDKVALRGREKIRSLHNLPVMNTRTGIIEKIDSDKIINDLDRANKSTRY